MTWLPWFAWIAIVGIIAGITYQIVIVVLKEKTRRVELSSGAGELRTVVENNTAVNTELLDKLHTLDTRLAAVEKTLTDIPS